MALKLERGSVRPGYSVLELPAVRAVSRTLSDAAADLDQLERQLGPLEREITAVQRELVEVERQAKAAIQDEDPESAAAPWREKHRVLHRVAELQDKHIAIQGQWQAELRSSLVALQRERSELDQAQAHNDRVVDRLVSSVEKVLQELLAAADACADLSSRERLWQARLENLAGRKLREPAAASRDAADSSARAIPATNRIAGAAGSRPDPSRRWAVYDPDAGKLVSTLAELLRLLARWYPAVRNEGDRVREFLTLPNAAPLPDSLRRELEQAGYLESAGPEPC